MASSSSADASELFIRSGIEGLTNQNNLRRWYRDLVPGASTGTPGAEEVLDKHSVTSLFRSRGYYPGIIYI